VYLGFPDSRLAQQHVFISRKRKGKWWPSYSLSLRSRKQASRVNEDHLNTHIAMHHDVHLVP
jgi:hypothetical protein